MVEVQIGFIAVKTGRTEYIFLPKLRSICLLNRAAEKVSLLHQWILSTMMLTMVGQDYNTIAIRNLSQKKRISPLKKVKRKVGYGEDASEPSQEEGPPQEQMKRLRLTDQKLAEGQQEQVEGPDESAMSM